MSFGKGGIGGILGGILGSILAPEIGIPALLASGAGSFLGSSAQGLVSGEKPGKALLGGLESGALSAGLTGLGDVLTGVPLSSSAGPLGSVFGGGTGGTGAELTGGAVSPVGGGDLTAGSGAVTDVTPLAAPGSPATATAGSGASLGGGDVAGLSANVSGTPAIPDLSTSLGTSGPTSGSGDIAGGLNAREFGQLTGGGGTGINSIGGTSLTSAGAPAADVGGTFSSADAPGGGGGAGSFGSSIANYLKANPGILLGGASLLPSLIKGNPDYPSQTNLNASAANLTNQGNTSLSALTTGVLPPGAQSTLDTLTQNQKAGVRSNFSRLGLTGSTMEASALNKVDQDVNAQKFNIIQDMVRTGLGEVNAANSVYEKLLNQEVANDKGTQDALARFAAALAGSSGGTGRTATA